MTDDTATPSAAATASSSTPTRPGAEARRGWIMLTSLFVGGAILVALAAMVT